MKKFNPNLLWKKAKGFWNQAPEGRFLNLKEILCFGSTTLGVQFISCIVNAYVTIGYLPTLYNMGTYGSLHATIIFIVAYGLGMILSPVYSNWMQRTKTKFGKYKPFILFMAPIVSLFGVLACWSPDNMSITGTTVYCYLTCVPLLFVWNLWYNTFNMFPSVISPNQQERTDIYSPIGLVGGFAPTLINVLRQLFVGWFGDKPGARVLGVTCVIIGLLCVVSILKVKERVFVTEDENANEKISMGKALKAIFKNKPLMILTLALICGSLKGALDTTWEILARIKYASSPKVAVQILGATSMIIGFAATPNMILLPFLTRKFNNRTIMLGWQGINALGYLILALIGIANIPVGVWGAVIITACRFMCAFNAIGSLQPLMLSEITDYQQNISGYRLQGYIQTMAYSVVMFVWQVALLIPALIQGQFGFNPNNYEIPKGATDAFRFDPSIITVAENYMQIVTWISFSSCVLMFIALCFYPLSKKKYAQVMEELKAKSVNAAEIESEKSHGIDIGEDDNTNTPSDNGTEQATENQVDTNVDTATITEQTSVEEQQAVETGVAEGETSDDQVANNIKPDIE